MITKSIVLLSVLLLNSCEKKEKTPFTDDLNSIRKNFILSIMENKVEESPFHMNYDLRTVFFSQDIVSLFGVVNVYDHLPHGWWRYEGKTHCRIQGKLQEVKLLDLFPAVTQQEFLRRYCEDSLKSNTLSYFSGEDPLRTRLEYDDLHTFVIDDKFLFIVFQPYTAGGLEDEPFHVKIPFEYLREHWNTSHPLTQLISRTISSKSYTSSWDQDDFMHVEIGTKR